MHERAAYHLGSGLAWVAFWIMVSVWVYSGNEVKIAVLENIKPTEVVENE